MVYIINNQEPNHGFEKEVNILEYKSEHEQSTTESTISMQKISDHTKINICVTNNIKLYKVIVSFIFFFFGGGCPIPNRAFDIIRLVVVPFASF